MKKLLIVDDEPNVLFALEEALGTPALSVVTARTGAQAIARWEQESPDVVLLDVKLPDVSGLHVLRHIQTMDPRVPLIIMTAFASTDMAIEAMKQGAFDYLLKPLDLDELNRAVGMGLEMSRLRHVPAVFDESSSGAAEVDRIVGQSRAMQEVYKAIGRVASQNVNVLLLGESGTGKELIARAILHHSPRQGGPFVSINCAAIPDTLLESELFGHERGAFTGADRRRIGKFEQATHGTIFLDEIGDMSMSTQAKVLRLIQDQTFERLGGSESIQTDARIISATNRNLEQMVAEGQFREDLFYRLKVFVIELPPLRERMEDLSELVRYIVTRTARELNKPVSSIPAETMSVLASHTWPGNVRELQSVLKTALVTASGDVLAPRFLPPLGQAGPGELREEFLAREASRPVAESGNETDLVRLVEQLLARGEMEIYRKVLGIVDEVILRTVLDNTENNQVRAAEVLGISRTTLRAKLRASERPAMGEPKH